MYINTTLAVMEAATVQNEAYLTPTQFSIDLLRADHAMFESLINLDLMEAFNESGVATVSESDMELALEAAGSGILAKIKELIRKMKDAVVRFIKGIQTKLAEVFSKDKRLIKKYEKDFDKAIDSPELRGSGKESKEYEMIDFSARGAIMASITDFNLRKCNDVQTSSDPAKALESLKRSNEELVKNLKERMDKLTKKQSANNIIAAANDDYWKRIKDMLVRGRFESLENLKKAGNVMLKEIESMRKTVEKERYSAGDRYDKDKDVVAKYNATFGALTQSQITINKLLSIGSSLVRKEYSIARKQFAQVAKMVNDKKKEEESDDKQGAKQEAAFQEWALGELSDICMEEAFEG